MNYLNVSSHLINFAKENHHMKILVLTVSLLIYCFIALIFAGPGLSQVVWVRQDAPTDRILNACYFINSSTGWICGDSGLIMKTTDAGNNWTNQQSTTFSNIERIFFLNQRLGYAFAWCLFPDTNEYLGTYILKTTNGGDLWTRTLYADTNRFAKDIHFIDSTTGFIGGTPLFLAKTTNAGTTWINSDPDTANTGLPVFSIKFFNSLTGYASGGFRDIAGTMWRTSDGGIRWFASQVGPEPLTDLAVLSATKVIACGGDFEYGSSYVKTLNGGLNWAYDTLGVFGVANAIDFRNQNEGWIVLGISQKYGYTLDGGLTWTNTFTPDSVILTDLQFTDSLHGYAVGYFGTLLKYDGTMSNATGNPPEAAPGAFTLHQNYPNPFNPETSIRFDVAGEGFVELKLYDNSGKMLRILESSQMRAGSYSIRLNASDLPSGIYFCKMSYAPGRKASAGVQLMRSIKLVVLK